MQVTTLLSGTFTANTTGSAVAVDPGVFVAAVFVNVTALSGTSPSVTVYIDDSPDGGAWATLANTAAINTTGVTALRITNPMGAYVRARIVLGGTSPSATLIVMWVGRP